MLVSEQTCIYNRNDSIAVAKFNDLFFFELTNDGITEQVVLSEQQVKNLIKDLEAVVR